MAEFFEVLGFSFTVTGPIFVLLGLGVLLMRTGMLTDAFVAVGSRLVFTIALPTLMFLAIARTRIEDSANPALIAFGLGMTLAVYLFMEWVARVFVQPVRDRGVVVQGAFRSNMGIIGLAYCVNAYGEAGLAAASLYMGMVTILFNVLAVVTLSRSLHKSQGAGRMLKGIVTNPLIIGIVLALPVSWLQVPLPKVMMQAGKYVGDLSLPLALLCTGASLDFKSLRAEMGNTLISTLGKLVLVPLLFTLGAAALGFRGIELGIVLLMASAPTAAASYVMVRAMGGNATLAANTIALTTLGSLLCTSVGVMVLRGLGMM